MGVLVPVAELAADFAGVTLDVFGPPATDVVNGPEDFLRRLVGREGDGKTRASGCSGGHVGLLTGLVTGPASILRCPALAAIGNALRHLRPAATYLAGPRRRRYVTGSDGGLDAGALGKPGQLRAAVTGLRQQPLYMLFHGADRQLQRPGYLPVGVPGD